MIAQAALVIKDTFAPRLASIQLILDSVEFFEKPEVILFKVTSSSLYMFLWVNYVLCSDSTYSDTLHW